jgi:hypothetical protein
MTKESNEVNSALEIFAEQVIVWAELAIEKEGDGSVDAESILALAKSLGLPN